MNYKQIGDIGQNGAIGALSQYGLGIAYPLSDNFPFDFIVIAGTRLFRAQVKSSSQHLNGSVFFGIKSGNFYSGEVKTYSERDIDIMICYDLRRRTTYLLTNQDIEGNKSFAIRFEPAKNKQQQGCHLHEEFVLSKERVKKVFDFDVPDFENIFAEINRKTTQYDHICDLCGKEFCNGSKNAHFCSKKCSGKKRQNPNKPAKEELGQLITTTPWTQIGQMFGVSDNAVRKWAKQYRLI